MVKNLGLTVTENKMISEIALVFNKYKESTRQFGLHLVHSHFDVNASEVMHETNDKLGRNSIVRPIPKEKLPENSYPTAWSVDKTGIAEISTWCCD
jgi:hypothetical protein